jgi:hypothetical protein
MATLETLRGGLRNYLSVVCPCGRALRAKVDMAGSEITCWECRRIVPVPARRASRSETLRALGRGWAETFSAEWFTLTFVAALAVVVALSVPTVGVITGALALAVVGVGYLRLLEQDGGQPSDEQTPEPLEPGPSARAVAIGALVFGLAVSLPVLVNPTGFGRTVQINPITALFLFVSGLVVPVGLASFFVRDHRNAVVGFKRLVAASRAHPLAMLLTLMAVPVAVCFGELLVFALATFYDSMGAILVERFPDAIGTAEQMGVPGYTLFSPGISGSAIVMRIYAIQLGHGYSLLGALLPSLSRWTSDGLLTSNFLVRFALTQLAVMIAFLAFSLQARWVRTLATLERRPKTV